jgi:hypothetical protein
MNARNTTRASSGGDPYFFSKILRIQKAHGRADEEFVRKATMQLAIQTVKTIASCAFWMAENRYNAFPPLAYRMKTTFLFPQTNTFPPTHPISSPPIPHRPKTLSRIPIHRPSARSHLGTNTRVALAQPSTSMAMLAVQEARSSFFFMFIAWY